MIFPFALACAARAAEPPDNIAETIAEAADACKSFDGIPDAADVLTIDDVNHDGGEDWIADYAKLKCEGGINPMCDVNGCVLQIDLWNGGTAWELAFEETVKSFRFAKKRGRRLLKVTMTGTACDEPSDKICTVTYRLEKDGIVEAH